MARKLKSDKLLFTATLLLVCISVVMVYSASAVMAVEAKQAPYYYLLKQAAWALLGLCFVPIVMRSTVTRSARPWGRELSQICESPWQERDWHRG